MCSKSPSSPYGIVESPGDGPPGDGEPGLGRTPPKRSATWSNKDGPIPRVSFNLKEPCTEAAWQADLAKIRQSLSTHGRSLFRWFRRDYREAIAALRGLLKSELPRRLADRLKIVDEVIKVRDVAEVPGSGPEPSLN